MSARCSACGRPLAAKLGDLAIDEAVRVTWRGRRIEMYPSKAAMLRALVLAAPQALHLLRPRTHLASAPGAHLCRRADRHRDTAGHRLPADRRRAGGGVSPMSYRLNYLRGGLAWFVIVRVWPLALFAWVPSAMLGWAGSYAFDPRHRDAAGAEAA